MIALDTNILVRLMAQDDPEQTNSVRRMLSGLLSYWIADFVKTP